jgi:hypothetical protein
MWEDFASAAETSDAKSPLLPRHAIGPAQAVLTRALIQDRQEGVITKGRPVLSPRVVSATAPGSPSQVTVEDCADASRSLKYIAATGKLKNDVPGGRHQITATVRLICQDWKVAEFTVRGLGSC